MARAAGVAGRACWPEAEDRAASERGAARRTARRRVGWWAAAAALLAACWAADARAALAATFTVTTTADEGQSEPVGTSCTNTPSGQCSLRAAIQAANAAGLGPHVIQLQGGATYTLAIPGRNEDAAKTGDLDVATDVRVVAGGGGSTIQAGVSADAGLDRVFDVRPGGALTLVGAVVRHGDAGIGDGGAIRSAGALTLTAVTVQANAAGGRGGGIYATGVPLLIRDSIVRNNAAGGAGGGIAVLAPASVPGTRLVTASTLVGNSALLGGGLHVAGNGPTGAAVRVENATLSGNVAAARSGVTSGFGGGLFVEAGGNVVLSSATLTANAADTGNGGGGLHSNGGALTAKNTIVAQNTAATVASDCRIQTGSLVSQGYLLFGTTGGCLLAGDATGFLTGNAGLLPLQDNGGFTPTHALVAGSQAIDAGNPAGCRDAATPTPAALAADQRGVPRSGNGRCDLGAFETNEGGPIVLPISDQTIEEDRSVVVPLLLADSDTPAESAALTVGAASSNPALLPPDRIVVGGSGVARSVTVSPATNASGGAVVTLTVRDADGLEATVSFGVTVLPIDDGPTIALAGSPRYVTGAPPVVLDPAARIDDANAPVYAGVELTAVLASGARAEDRLAIRTGAGPDAVVVQGSAVAVGGVQIGTVAGGAGATPLVVTLNGSATSARVQAVLRNLSFSTTDPVAASGEVRTVEVRLAGGGGAASNAARIDVAVVPLGAPGTCPGMPGAARPSVRVRPAVGGGRLLATVEAAPLDATTNNPIQSLRFTEVRNARVTLNGQPVAAGQAVATPGAVSVALGVERVAAGQPAHVAFVVVDSCGEWPTFVGGGAAAGF